MKTTEDSDSLDKLCRSYDNTNYSLSSGLALHSHIYISTIPDTIKMDYLTIWHDFMPGDIRC